jgi:hypothetical protein
MTPIETKLPKGYRITQRPTCQPRQDETKVLRAGDGHVLAAIEAWTPEPSPPSVRVN